jgi:dipeptidyl aminopeptidase/acylaminoacyl peptidase
MKIALTWLLAILAFAAAFGRGDAGEKQAPRRFRPDDMDRLLGVSSPRISPDGRSIVIVVSRVNSEKNRYDRELVLVDVATSKQRKLTFGRPGVGQPRWRPQGDRLAFLAAVGPEKEAKHQVFVMPMDGGDARRVTSAPSGVQHFTWSPDGRQIAYAAADEPVKKAKFDDAFEVGNDGFLMTAAPRCVHIWLVAADGGKARRLTSGSWSLPHVLPPGSPSSPLAWSPDGKSIAFVCQATPHFGDSHLATIQVVDVASGAVQPLTKNANLEGYPSFSPDGKHLTYRYPRDGDTNNVNEVFLVPANSGASRNLTREIDRNIVWSSWLPSGQGLMVGGHDGTRVALWQQPLDGAARKLDLGDANPVWSFWIDAHTGRDGAIAFAGSEPWRPSDLYYLSSPVTKVTRLTDLSKEIAGLQLGRVETITWDGPDGFRADGVLVLPPGFSMERKYPLVLYIHGGPTSASTEAFAHIPQVIAAHNYVVFMPNYRGSDNLGNGYQRAIFNDAGDGPGRDVMAGIEAVKKRGFVDSKRIAVTGWSYGGFMTAWLIGHYHIWKTAIAGATPADRADQYNFADYNIRAGFRFTGSPWVGDNDKAYREQSPITYAAKIRTPTLILSTTGDARVPITQSYRLYHALRDNGVPVRFVAYPVPGHYPTDPARRKDLAKRWVAWLDQYLK